MDFGPIPALEKALSGAPTSLPNGNFEVTYTFQLENNGTSEMCNISVAEDLDTQFGCAFVNADPASAIAFTNTSGSSIQPTINTAYEGDFSTNFFNGDGCLFPGDLLTWEVNVEITICDLMTSPLVNIATITAQDSDGNPVEDDSDDTSDLDTDGDPDNDSGGEDDPTFTWLPAVEITKEISSVTTMANGNVQMDFEFIVENTGNAPLSNLEVPDPLSNFGASLINVLSLSVTNLSLIHISEPTRPY